MAIVLVTFIVVVGVVVGSYWAFVVKPEEKATAALEKRLKADVVPRQLGVSLQKRASELSAVGTLDATLRRIDSLARPLQSFVEQSGARLTVGTLLLASGCTALVAFLAVQRFFGFVAVSATAAALAGAAPFAVVKGLRDRRLRKFEEQLPEALDLLARSLRAGHAFTSGVALVSEEVPAPLGPEFRLLHDRQNYGMPLPDALRDFAYRIPVLDAKFFVTAVLTQRESGGNLSEILDNLSSVMRERFKVKRQVRVISAHGRMTGWILAALPPVLGAAFMVTSDQHMETMFGDPLGRQMMVGAAVLQFIGMLIIRKIVRIEY